MKTNTLYSLYFMKNSLRLFFISLMIEYIFILTWWYTHPYNHTRTLWLPIAFTLIYGCLIFVFYYFRLKDEKMRIDDTYVYYYKKRFLRSNITFYPIEKLNDKIRLIAFRSDSDKTFIFSTFLQKKRYAKLQKQLNLFETDH